MTKEELKNYFTEVIHVGHEDYPVWELPNRYWLIEGVRKYYIPNGCTVEARWIVSVANGDCQPRRTHDRLHDEDFHLAGNEALVGDWILRPGCGAYLIMPDEWVQRATETDIQELYMKEVTQEEMLKHFSDLDRRPLMHLVQQLKTYRDNDNCGYFYDFGNGYKIYSFDTPETISERIIGRERTLEEMMKEQYGDSLPEWCERLLERKRERESEKSQQDEITQEPVQEEA